VTVDIILNIFSNNIHYFNFYNEVLLRIEGYDADSFRFLLILWNI